MSGPPDARPAGAGAAERVYALLLRAYPAEFRAAYGRDMALAFRDQRRALGRRAGPHGAPALGFWAATLWDVLRSAPALRLDALRARRRAGRRARRHGPWGGGPHLQPNGGTMKARRMAAATLAVLGGAYEVATTGAQVRAGYPEPNGGWGLAMALAALTGVLLLGAGVLLLRGGAGATRLSRGAALACLVLVAGLQLVFPFMSVFERLIGVGIPVVLLLVTRRPRGTPGRDASAPAVA